MLGRCDNVRPQTGQRLGSCAHFSGSNGAARSLDGGGFEALTHRMVRALGGVAVALLISGTAAACGGGGGGTSTAKDCGYKLAYFGALTGSSANLGINIRNGDKTSAQLRKR